MKKAEMLLHRLYDDAPMPTVVLSADLSTQWVNRVAKMRYPVLSLPHSIGLLLSAEQNDALPALLEKGSCFSLPVGAAGLDLVFLPYENAWVAQLVPVMGWDSAAMDPDGMQRVVSSINASLRLPLSRVFSGVSALARSGDAVGDERLLDIADEINEGGYALLRFAQNLTAYLRCLYGTMPPAKDALDLCELLAKLAPAAAMMTQKIEIPLETSLPEKTVVIHGDGEALAQAVLQIIGNSCRHTRAGNSILLRLEVKEGFALVTVSDCGAGIPADRLARAAQPFYSWDTTGLPGMGSGLGLTVAQHLISLQGGTMALTSQEGEGTTVAIRLPLAKEKKSTLQSTIGSADYLRDRFSPLQVILSDSCGAPQP